MSLQKGAARRVALLSGSSLAAAAALSMGAAILTPTAATAQVSCTPAPSSISGDSVTYSNSTAGVACTVTGDAAINISPMTLLQPGASGFGLDLDIADGATATLNVEAYAGPAPASGNSNGPDGRLSHLRAEGGGDFVGNVNGRLMGALDLSGLDGEAELNILHNGNWYIDGEAVDFGDGDAVLTTDLGGVELGYPETGPLPEPMRSVGGRIYAGVAPLSGDVIEPVHAIDFGLGDDLFDNAGYFVIGGAPDFSNDGPKLNIETSVSLLGLETFVNRGAVLLGAYYGAPTSANFMGTQFHETLEITDEWHDDILSMPGATLVGSRVVDADGQTALRWNGELAVGEFIMDVDVAGVQTECVRDGATGDLPAADCLILDGGATDASENPIYIRIVEPVPGDRGVVNSDGIVLVDMGDAGASAHGDVAISPNQVGYNPLFGGFMDKGAFAYVIAFDEDTNQHKLFSGASANVAQMPLIAQSGHALWRTSTGTWFDRQADLRSNPEGNVGGVWGRVTAEQAERDATHTLSFVDQDFVFDNTYEQTSYAVTGGFDLLFGNEGDTAYVAGLMLGYAHADLEWEASPNEARIEAWTGGAYASLVSGGLYVDGAINVHNALLRYDAPAMNLFPAGTILDTDMVSVGGQVEAGWRIPMFMDGAFIEPLAGLSYVRTKYDDLDIPADDPGRQGVTVAFDDPTSLRAGVGARAGIDQDFGAVRAQFSGLLRLWNEFEDETSTSLINPGATGMVVDEFSGQFTEAGVGASIFSPGGMVSAFVNLGGRFGDDYQATTASAGVRVNW